MVVYKVKRLLIIKQRLGGVVLSETNNSLSARRSSSRSGSANRKPKKNLIPHGIMSFIIFVVIGLWFASKNPSLAIFWMTGIAFGFILQRSRFCFTASMRDPLLTGVTSVLRSVLIAFAITSIGFWAIKYGAFVQGLPIPGMGYVVPVSFATAIGATMFGIGMVIAGGCASGTLMRVGEGFMMQILSLTFFIIGSLLGAHDFGWWKENVILKGKSIFLPDYLGWFGALFAQLLLIVVLFVIADQWEQKKAGNMSSH
ncbi:MAG: YeeE/YedE family protein [Clostridiales bacterium]|nr:YeeE/YedE family protein [Clostridiales bacterium]